MAEHLYALDFDGVLCDSCGEASIAGLEAAKQRWPEHFKRVDAQREAEILERMHTVRPVVETGDDFLLLARVLAKVENGTSIASHLDEENILESWTESIKRSFMEEIGEARHKQELEDLLGSVRDAWISRDVHGWLKANRFYPGISDAIKFSSSKLFIVTTKEARFVTMSLKELAGVDFPEENIYGLGSGPKVEVLKKLQNRAEHQGMTLHFVEDRLSTLLNVIDDRVLNNWNLHLASWGYNTPTEREEASKKPRIEVLELADFCSKLK
ncbi:hypothetical protein SELMODRAFT_130886 [Selaginella moellendorffii]|uniref:Uncharacterized protein n=1 Tax=Selaginella moellendorffii TaxID=88036 RepID=D8T2U8_SELML|nr:uncharacterized protein LOC9629979 isoform X2 [Selaginella moellendorffii]EFJ08909.1 hypothetical protein SELMODRAFT_130886 [Selaginella moellendorffii]|eukprot:XP_002989896.1 uncharacterized protein LOC9629979 isoform X2 [Selaginella moellendorffii]